MGYSIDWQPIDSFTGNSTSPDLVDTRPCPVCDSSDNALADEMKQFQYFRDSDEAPKRVDIRNVQCSECDAVFMNPVLSDYGLQTLFAEAAMSMGASADRNRARVRWLENLGLVPAGTVVLDAGCHAGRFLDLLPTHTVRVGVDSDERAVRMGRELCHPDVTLLAGDVATVQTPRSPNLVTIAHVLEHLVDPKGTLVRLREIAASDSRLVAEVPVLEKGLTEDINGFLSPFHFTHFSQSSFLRCLAESGWDAIMAEPQVGYNGFVVLAEPSANTGHMPGTSDDRALLACNLTHHKQAIERVCNRIADSVSTNRVLIWGAGAHTEMLYHRTPMFEQNPQRLFALTDSDTDKHGGTWRGISVHPPEYLRGADWSSAQLIVSSYRSQDGIAAAAVEVGVPPERIIKLYDEIR